MMRTTHFTVNCELLSNNNQSDPITSGSSTMLSLDSDWRTADLLGNYTVIDAGMVVIDYLPN